MAREAGRVSEGKGAGRDFLIDQYEAERRRDRDIG